MSRWEERPPSWERVGEHAVEHPCALAPGSGLWMVRGTDLMPSVVPMRQLPDGAVEAFVGGEWMLCPRVPDDYQHPEGYEWRPLSAGGDPT